MDDDESHLAVTSSSSNSRVTGVVSPWVSYMGYDTPEKYAERLADVAKEQMKEDEMKKWYDKWYPQDSSRPPQRWDFRSKYGSYGKAIWLNAYRSGDIQKAKNELLFNVYTTPVDNPCPRP